MKTLNDIIKEAINESMKGQGSNIFDESIRRSEADIRRSSIKNVEEFIEACSFLAENDASAHANLLAVAKGAMVVGGALGYYMAESGKEKEDTLLYLVARLPDLYAAQIIKIAARAKAQKQTIENLSSALSMCKGGSNET